MYSTIISNTKNKLIAIILTVLIISSKSILMSSILIRGGAAERIKTIQKITDIPVLILSIMVNKLYCGAYCAILLMFLL